MKHMRQGRLRPVRAGESHKLKRARQCYKRRAWANAYHGFLSADQEIPLEADDSRTTGNGSISGRPGQ